MAIKITYANGETEILPAAVRVDEQNFHEGMFDFYDKDGNLLKQISLFEKIRWEILNETEIDSEIKYILINR
jgi:hypothetical protein